MRKNNTKGFTVIELVIAMGILMLVAVFITYFSLDIADATLRYGRMLITQQTIQSTLEVMIPEIRSAGQANDGSYPLSIAGTSTLEFYSDLDGDGLLERVRYYLSDETFKKAVIPPSGTPPRYVSSTETLQDLVENVVPGDQLFQYYDSTATSTNSTALSQPVDVSRVKTVKVTLIANQGTDSTPSLVGTQAEAAIRNVRYQQP